MVFLSVNEGHSNMIEIVYYSDWVKVFKDGFLITEGHHVNERYLLMNLGFDVTTREATEEEESEFS